MRLGSYLKNDKFPNIIDQAIELGKSYLRYKLAGSPTIPFDVQQERLIICNSCDKLDQESRRCYECGCFVDEKTLWATESCPLHKWESVIKQPTEQQDSHAAGCGCGSQSPIG